MTKAISKSYTLDYSSKCPCTFLANLPLQMPLLYKGCIEHGYNFIDNGAISTTDQTDGIHLLESSMMKITKNLISGFNYFLGTVIQNSRSRLGKGKILFILRIVLIAWLIKII